MKRVTALATLLVVCSVVGCASTRQEHMISKDGVTLYCGSIPAQSDGSCPTDSPRDAPRSAPDGVYYKVERDPLGPEPSDPGAIPNFGR